MNETTIDYIFLFFFAPFYTFILQLVNKPNEKVSISNRAKAGIRLKDIRPSIYFSFFPQSKAPPFSRSIKLNFIPPPLYLFLFVVFFFSSRVLNKYSMHNSISLNGLVRNVIL